MEALQKFLNQVLFTIGDFSLEVHMIITAIVIFILTKILLWIVKKMIFRYANIDEHGRGNVQAIYQIISYVVWVAAAGFILEAMGIELTLLLAGSAALLVGVGFGLQQTFNDIISGFILLAERSIKVGDILEIDGNVVRIESIGVRTSKGLDTDDIVIIIPNSLITTSKVINWSHQQDITRFRVNVRVAYGSEVDHVIKILEESAFEHPEVDNRELVKAHLFNLGSTAMEFQLLFFSKNRFRIERVKSVVRTIVVRKFREQNISIAFPQLDVHLNKSEL